jgi:protein-tyrosine phosphatase
MIDVHSHLIYGVDDGPPTIKESIRMVLEAERIGIKTIIATPHYRKGLFKAENAVEHYIELKSRVKDCNIEILLGYEVYFDSIIPDVMTVKDRFTLNKSKYLLFEMPFDIIPSNISDVILNLHMENFIPVIAHPERNRFFVKNFQFFLEFIESGCLIQLDAASILGVYGSAVKKFTKNLIKLNLAHFVSSDAHSATDYINWYLPAYEKVKCWGGAEYAETLFYKNQKMLLGL